LSEYPDLRKVVELWPKLREVMRKGIVGMLKGVSHEE